MPFKLQTLRVSSAIGNQKVKGRIIAKLLQANEVVDTFKIRQVCEPLDEDEQRANFET